MTAANGDDKRPLTQAEVDERVVALLRQMTAFTGTVDYCGAPECDQCAWAAEAAALLREPSEPVVAAQDEAAATTGSDGSRKDWLTRLGEMDDDE